jgi:hypothetical protein
VDTYLEIAQAVLRAVRRPLSALQILRSAYALGVAPPHISGRTQHKTLGARLSEDILQRRDGSRFYRTAPGRFLLRELADDPGIPERLRRPIVARRRKRDLPQRQSLAFDASALAGAGNKEGVVDTPAVLKLIRNGCYHYASNARAARGSDVIVWAFMLVVRGGRVLSYRQGHYREDRDTFMHKRTIGFYTPVIDADLTLFEQKDHGIVLSGLKALAADLDLEDRDLWTTLVECSTLCSFVRPETDAANDLLAVVSFKCPDWLEPTTTRLALNDLEWLDLRLPLNHDDDFDPWSKAVLSKARQLSLSSI